MSYTADQALHEFLEDMARVARRQNKPAEASD
jgi:hypothetical protein